MSGFLLKFVVLLVLALPTAAQLNLFFCRNNSGCFFGFLGSTMYRMDDTECVEQCKIFPFFAFDWTCGFCEDETGAEETPGSPPSPTPPSPTPPTPTPPTPTPPSAPTVPATPAPFAPITLSPVPPTASLPAGPYVSADYSETITVPAWPSKSGSDTQTNCPHDESGLLDWHSASTWTTTSLPEADQDVTLPANSKVVIRKTVTESLGIIYIPNSSSLIIGENSDGIELTVHGMDVEGELTVGSESCRLQEPVTITLTGTRPGDAVTNRRDETFKGISVTGTLNLHGKHYYRSWTRLSKTVMPGDDVLLVQHEVNWEVGQQILVTTSALKDSREWHRNEVFTIANIHYNPVSGVGAAVYLEETVQYQHTAISNYQVEVGLLSRVIKVQGSAVDSEPTDPDPLNCQTSDSSVYTDRTFDRYDDTSGPCPYKEITGFGGHIMVHGGGKGYVAGTELYRMGQTNVLGRYPIHFHLLGDCPDCYFRDSSVHRSFYRCISIHGTNKMTVQENVAYDVIGFCYYLEDGVEQENDISYNLASFIHSIGPGAITGTSQTTFTYTNSTELTLPADVTAAGYYITNVHNTIVGNAASGGWAGFAFPLLDRALQSFRYQAFRPSSVTAIKIDGNTAHSTGWWWGPAGAFYLGGTLKYESDNFQDDTLSYNPGRSGSRNPCLINVCTDYSCGTGCPSHQHAWLRLTNTKAFLTGGVGLNSWTGRAEIIGFESHDTTESVQALSSGFWLDNSLAVCRHWKVPEASGFTWYDTQQEHIITRAVYRNCGYQTDDYSDGVGCGKNDNGNGCSERSSVFTLLTHSDQFTPELMQATKEIKYENCGRHFMFSNPANSVSARQQTWLDVDGSTSGNDGRTFIVSGHEDAADWWGVDDNAANSRIEEGPLRFIDADPKTETTRELGHVRIEWDDSLHSKVGSGASDGICGNGNGKPCVAVGNVRHTGKMFSAGSGLGITGRGDIVGPVGGYGWIMNFDGGAPRTLKFSQVEVVHYSKMIISIPYPTGTTFNVQAKAASWCWSQTGYSCSETYTSVSSVDAVRNGPGNTYHVDSNGVLTLRIVQLPNDFVRRPDADDNPEWFIPDEDDPDRKNEGFAVRRFERYGIYLPAFAYHNTIEIAATCGGSGAYCSGSTYDYDPDVCQSGYEQVAYDFCCRTSDDSDCVFAN